MSQRNCRTCIAQAMPFWLSPLHPRHHYSSPPSPCRPTGPAATRTRVWWSSALESRLLQCGRYLKNAAALKLATGPYKVTHHAQSFESLLVDLGCLFTPLHLMLYFTLFLYLHNILYSHFMFYMTFEHVSVFVALHFNVLPRYAPCDVFQAARDAYVAATATYTKNLYE